ncbi:MAG TPA: hypothetical protein PKD85_19195 [Saprospiraceae bacterium]|nr:hypothetical protein [Saprospiraceae bacterium]
MQERLQLKIINLSFGKLMQNGITEQYQNLTTMINDNLPLRAFPIRELVQIFRQKSQPITLKTELTITDER